MTFFTIVKLDFEESIFTIPGILLVFVTKFEMQKTTKQKILLKNLFSFVKFVSMSHEAIYLQY